MPTEYSGSGDPQRTIDLLWGVHRRRRGPKPSLSGEQVVTTAIQIADRHGLGGLSMRRLADELDITAMSLYGYVPSKAELLDVMADRAYGEIAVPRDPAMPWQARLAALAEQHWALLLSHSWLLQIAASRPLPGPNITAFYDAELAAVDGLGGNAGLAQASQPVRPRPGREQLLERGVELVAVDGIFLPVWRPPPALGEHTSEILAELGL